ncbi:MAG TPA: CpaD family pilus assembly lipoprotein [Magnetospirillum sp.]|jgi:hypothetical protein|nr:CpaD family pilus assembly lipoprotein [Magnetospirillum sp.]
MTRFPAILPVFLAPLLTGCFLDYQVREMPTSAVIGRAVSLVDSVAVADLGKPTEAEKTAIAAALTRGGPTGLRVRVRLPQGSPQPGDTVARGLAEGLGVDPAIARVDTTGPAGGPASVEVLRITLTPPDCAGMITPNDSNGAASRPTMAFGCAGYTNLTNMLVDPADLQAPRSFGGPDGTGTAGAAGRYYADKVKPLRRSTTTSNLSGGGSP